MSSFLSLGVPENLAAVLAASGKTEAFPIQRDTLPDSLAGRDALPVGCRPASYARAMTWRATP